MNLIETCMGCKMCPGSGTNPLLFYGTGLEPVLAIGSAEDLMAKVTLELDISGFSEKGIATTFTVRCLPYNDEEDVMGRLDVCSVYTRALTSGFWLILMTRQAADQLGVDGFHVGKSTYTPYGWVLFVDDLRHWLAVPDWSGIPTSQGKTGKGWLENVSDC